MTNKVLKFTSPAILLDVLEESKEHSMIVDQWAISERRFLGARENPPVTGNYRVELERELAAGEDTGNAFIEGEYLAHALERAWLYGTGAMLWGHGYKYFLHPARLPHGWTSNAEAVIPEDSWKLLSDGSYLGSLRRTAPTLPLEHCLAVLFALTEANDVALQLVTYHVGAVTSLDADLTFLLFAQGLEIGRSLINGRTKADKIETLPKFVSDRLPRDLDWYFEASNQRRQTRHAIDKRGAIALKPDFDEEEGNDFVAGANVLLHYLVTLALGIPLILDENGNSIRVA
jgi:hypothetical protein